MDQIKHNFIEINGIKLHVAEIGSESSPAVVFLHGFPEIWYTWRHQMIAVANAGYRAIVPDYRGYGLSDIPAEPEKTSFFNFVHDTASILDSLAISKIDENVQREIINHRSLRHPNIVRFKEVSLTRTHLVIVMEYAAGGELFSKITSAGRFSEDEARFFFQQLISGVSYCHSMEICHRDLKLENTLLDGSPSPRLKILTVYAATVLNL